MSGRQTYEQIEDIIKKFDNLSKDEILTELKNVLTDPCPSCGIRCDTVNKSGRQLNRNAIFGAAEIVYELCSNCHYMISYDF